MSFWVYILRCADGSYYTGHTDNLESRIQQHHSGAIAGCYTFKRRPLQLVFSQDFSTRDEALTSERQIKGWSRKKKEAMMRGDWAEVSRLAISPFALSSSKGKKPQGFDKLSPNGREVAMHKVEWQTKSLDNVLKRPRQSIRFNIQSGVCVTGCRETSTNLNLWLRR